MKMRERSSGQTKEKLSSRESAGIVQGRDQGCVCALAQSAFRSRRENRHAAIANAQQAVKGQPESRAQRIVAGTALARQNSPTASSQGSGDERVVPRGRRFGRRIGKAGARSGPRHHAAAGKILKPGKRTPGEVRQISRGHKSVFAIGVEASRRRSVGFALQRSEFWRMPDSDGQHIARSCAPGFAPLPDAGDAGHVYVWPCRRCFA